MSGYTDCACRDCFEIAIGKRGVAMCHACEDAGCGVDSECEADDAYGDEADCSCSRGGNAATCERHTEGAS